mgnify:CR=1 FL=1
MIQNQEEINKITENREIATGTGTLSIEVTKIVETNFCFRGFIYNRPLGIDIDRAIILA